MVPIEVDLSLYSYLGLYLGFIIATFILYSILKRSSSKDHLLALLSYVVLFCILITMIPLEISIFLGCFASALILNYFIEINSLKSWLTEYVLYAFILGAIIFIGFKFFDLMFLDIHSFEYFVPVFAVISFIVALILYVKIKEIEKNNVSC